VEIPTGNIKERFIPLDSKDYLNIGDINKALSELNLQSCNLLIQPSTIFYVKKGDGDNNIFIPRFASPQIQPTVATSLLRQVEEVIAAFSPHFATIPINLQEKIIKAFQSIRKEGEIVEVDGLITPKESPLIKTIVGFDENLQNPRFNVHFYDKEKKDFQRSIRIIFIDAKTELRIKRINEELNKLNSEELGNYLNYFKKIWNTYSNDGLLERLIANERSLGFMASDKGLTAIDLHELLIKFKSEKEMLKHLVESDFKGLNLDLFQKKVLLARYERYQGEKNVEFVDSIVPNQIDILRKAIELLREKPFGDQEKEEIENYLKELINIFQSGKEVFFHNIGRGILAKFNPKEFYDGKQHHFERLLRILKSGGLIPAEGAYSKGIYLSVFNLSFDSLKNFISFLIQSYEPEEGVKNFTLLKLNFSLLFEKLKNPFNSPIILELDMNSLPRFKHQTCATCYVGIPKERIRRIVVETIEDIEKVREVLKQVGMDIPLITLDRFKKEISLLEEARRKCFQELGINLF